jgi:hypothetical protein
MNIDQESKLGNSSTQNSSKLDEKEVIIDKHKIDRIPILIASNKIKESFDVECLYGDILDRKDEGCKH